MKHNENQRPRFGVAPSPRVAALCIALVALTLVGVSGRADEDDTYYLTAWRYGAIAWVQTVSLGVAFFTDRLTWAADYAFTFWGLDAPTPPASWEHPGENPSKFSMTGLTQIRKKDPSTGEMWRLDPLLWRGEQIYPLLVIAFRNQETMRSLLHDPWVGAMFTAGAAAISGAELWLRTLLGCPRIVLCDVIESTATLVHEFTHWLFVEWYTREGGERYSSPPSFIIEGMAEVTEARFRSADRRDTAALFWSADRRDDYVREWLESNRLADGVSGHDDYVIGEGFVRYLVELLTPLGFLETLPDWGSRPAELIALYEPGWRASLGLPRECGTDQGDAE